MSDVINKAIQIFDVVKKIEENSNKLYLAGFDLYLKYCETGAGDEENRKVNKITRNLHELVNQLNALVREQHIQERMRKVSEGKRCLN